MLKNVVNENLPKTYKIIGKIIRKIEKVNLKDFLIKLSLLFEKYGKIFIIPKTENVLKYNPTSKIIYGFMSKMIKTVKNKSFSLSLIFPKRDEKIVINKNISALTTLAGFPIKLEYKNIKNKIISSLKILLNGKKIKILLKTM